MANIQEGFLETNNFVVPNVQFEPHLLISSVRKEYSEYLCKLLKQNYISWCGEVPPLAVFNATKELELKAAARSMLVPLYRQAIVSMIKSIKKCTKTNDLYPEFRELCIKSQYCDKSSQTDDHCINNENSFVSEAHKDNVSVQDDVLKEMEELFKVDDDKVRECDIFDNVTNEIHIKLILDEINKYNKCNDINSINESGDKCAINDTIINDEKCNLTLNEQVSSSDNVKTDLNTNSRQQNDFAYSRWPCELYYQRKMLCEKLDDICERNFRLHSSVKDRFTELFGADSEDEQGLQSPDTSIDFIRSCRQRIAPWVARHMKPYYYNGYVSHHLLRPLNKHLIYKLVQINQYPSDYEVYLYVKEYFKHHSRIKCQADF